jgi:hypothetical protein
MSPGLRPPSLFCCAIQRITLGNKRLWFALLAYQPCLKDLVDGALSAGVFGVRVQIRRAAGSPIGCDASRRSEIGV